MIVYGIDPGAERCGVVVIDGPGVGVWTEPAASAFRYVEADAWLCIEDQYLGVNFRSSKALIEARVRAEECFVNAGGTRERIVRVYPATWQASFGIRGKRRERIAAYVKVARRLAPGLEFSADEAAAFLLATWLHDNLRLGIIPENESRGGGPAPEVQPTKRGPIRSLRRQNSDSSPRSQAKHSSEATAAAPGRKRRVKG